MKSKANQMESREEEEELVHMFFHCIAVNKLIPANSSTHHTMSGSQCSFTHGMLLYLPLAVKNGALP
jgi:hypothetical protein